MTLVNKVLLIYTGGTIGMNRNPRTGALEPFKFEHLLANVPELNDFDVEINTYQFTPPIDSSDMSPALWIDLVHIIANNYAKYDEKFFLYYEEVDLQCQMAKNNLKRVLIDGPKVIHLGRAGNRSVDEIIGYGSFSTIHHEISRVRYGKKNISKAIGLFLKAVTAIQWLSPYILKNTKPYFKTLMKV